MTKVEHKIEQLTKRLNTALETIPLVSIEYSAEIEALEKKLKEAKDKIKSVRLSESEAKYYKLLSVALKTENPLSVLLRLFLIEEITDTTSGRSKYIALGSDRETWYTIDEEVSVCTCPRFSAKHDCPHIQAVRLLTRLKYGSSVAATFGIENKGENL